MGLKLVSPTTLQVCVVYLMYYIAVNISNIVYNSFITVQPIALGFYWLDGS